MLRFTLFFLLLVVSTFAYAQVDPNNLGDIVAGGVNAYATGQVSLLVVLIVLAVTYFARLFPVIREHKIAGPAISLLTSAAATLTVGAINLQSVIAALLTAFAASGLWSQGKAVKESVKK